MTYPKMKPCPKCGLTEFLEIYDYDGWKHVECNNGFNSTPTPPATEACHYLGPGEGTILMAIRRHNEQVQDRAALSLNPSDADRREVKT